MTTKTLWVMAHWEDRPPYKAKFETFATREAAEAVSKGQAEALDRIRRADSTNSGVGGVVWWREAQS